MQELLWLLLPLAAASGWMAGRRNARKRQVQKSSNTTYYRGLNFLLNEEPDKAIDVFVEMLEVDSETVETHLALGSLFRRRGEVDRAIRIHQNLIARPALNREQRAQALLELGQDYMKAGLYDRAESLFRELRDMRLHVKPALRHLRTIYQQERDWQACLETVEALQPMTEEPLALEKAHYYCELALQAKKEGRTTQAVGYLKKAMASDKNCVRGPHIMAKVEAEQGNTSQAISLLQQSIRLSPQYLPEVLPELVAQYKIQGDMSGLRHLLERTIENHQGCGADVYLADLLRDEVGDKAAVDYLSSRMHQSPSLQGLIRIIELNARLPEGDVTELLNRLRQSVARLLEERPQYQCSKCGLSTMKLHWQCPSCRSWSTIKRRTEIEGESA